MAFGDFTVDRNSTKYVLGSGGKIIPSATDEPAIEFNADGSYKGLLVEPAATNICLQSEDFSKTWATLNAVITTNDTTAPDGTTTADKIGDIDNDAFNSVFISQNITVSASTKYTASVFCKKDQLDIVLLRIENTGASTYKYFYLSNGTLGTGVGVQDATIEEYPDGWYRCSITWTQGSTNTSAQFRIYPSDGDSFVDLDGTSSIFVWGAQFEAGPIATSYIPTTTASVTRVKDDITLTSASSLIGQTEGTLYVEVDWRLATGVTQWLLSASDGTSNNRFDIVKNNSDDLLMIARADNSTLTSQGESSSGYSGIQKIAFAYADADFELYRNGSSVSSDTVGSLAALATLTDIDLGQLNVAIDQANMWIRAVALYPKRLSDAECEALTTL